MIPFINTCASAAVLMASLDSNWLVGFMSRKSSQEENVKIPSAAIRIIDNFLIVIFVF
mgnify:CR=1 FL=1